MFNCGQGIPPSFAFGCGPLSKKQIVHCISVVPCTPCTVEGNKICEGEVRLKVFSYFLETSLKRFLSCSVRMKLTIV